MHRFHLFDRIMHNIKKCFSVAPWMAMAVLLASCGQFEKTKTGLPYQITKGSGGSKLKEGQFVMFNIEFKLPSVGDTVLSSTYGHIPAVLKYEQASLGKYNFTEVLPQCSVGDKIDFSLSIDSLKSLGMIPEYNKIFKKGDFAKGKVELLGAYNTQQEMEAQYTKQTDLEKEREIKALEAYCQKNNIKAVKTPSGALVEVIVPGDLLAKADTGKKASVYYKGYTEAGKVFDSNNGEPKKEPFSFVVGTHSVIPGWDEGVKLFGKGGKGKILVPAMLGYGQQGAGADIKPFTNLIFDIEISDVTVNTPPPPAPAPPSPVEPIRPRARKEKKEEKPLTVERAEKEKKAE